MKSFELQRFALLIKHEITEHARGYLRFTLGAFVAFFVVNFLLSYEIALLNREMDITSIVAPTLHSISGTSMLITVLLMIVSISSLYSNMNTKQERIRFLMIPATNLEKYLCRWLQLSVIAPLLIVATYCAADLCCWMVRGMLGHGLGISMTYFFDDAFRGLFFRREWDEALIAHYEFNPIVCIALLALLSTYHFGGALFRRVPYIFTTLAIIACGVALTIVGTTLAALLLNEESMLYFLDRLAENNDIVFAVIFYVLPLAWAILCHWLSYRMLTRANVITHKTFGL